ncbi:LLM class flavin-dependent oxidoreductase [Cellulomonas sp. ACRRI]|uniref:LLM class flavin-dependent oxidoreductase n=1 Tax=Cellulomonas sp. ACRRI TaxID=2918188 RepID=UPI001EF2CFEA|nr:LLM class flavin-dependent oxidoreductase [Cellulomonas sp. ACRRI]MCG7287977.1 LLM class flavin-dependent oxidoreductase [Cellulomonas sp. ACRRI]
MSGADLGHPLQLGVELPVSAADPGAAVRLARRAEELGLDLVVVADAADDGGATGAIDGGGALEAWTVLAAVAGATEQVEVATRGLRLDGRPPAVLARAVASLDHLAGGRVTPGLAAGTDGDDPDDALDALAEAVDVLRGMWAEAEPGPLVLEGRHHRVLGAPRGPSPAHNLALWLGGTLGSADAAAGARTLAARVADGWWLGAHDPDGAGARLDAVLREQAALDAALTAAGRDPREVRRGLVLDAGSTGLGGREAAAPGVAVVDDLAALVLDAGVGTLVLSGADEPALLSFAVVAAAVRDRVAAARAARGTRVGTVRSAAVRAARAPGIDYDAIPGALVGTAVEPGDAGYAAVRSTYLRGGRPGLVLRPGDTAEVVDALAYARAQDVPLAIRSGGHGISGRSTNDGGIVLDLSRMAAIEVLDVATRRVRIQPGARWGEVAAALHPYGWALTSGDYGGVGVGGLATAGGIGFLVREHGLTLDHLRAAEVVLADGSVVRVSADENADLFWGVRGAGANLGIVTSFEFEVDEVGDVGFAQLVFDASDTEQFLVDYGATLEAAPRDTTAFLIMGPPRGGIVAAQVMAMVDSDDPETIIERLNPFARIAPLLQQQVQVVPYPAVVSVPQRHTSEGEPVTRSGMAEHLTPELAADAARLVRSGATPFFQIRAAGGAVHDVPADATAYAHRSANFSIVAMGSSRRRIDAIWDAMAHHFHGTYLSFETDPRPERLADVYPGPTLERLRELKRRYDPEDVFRHNYSVAEPPAVVL